MDDDEDLPRHTIGAMADMGRIDRLRWKAANAVLGIAMWAFNRLVPDELQEAAEEDVDGEVEALEGDDTLECYFCEKPIEGDDWEYMDEGEPAHSNCRPYP